MTDSQLVTGILNNEERAISEEGYKMAAYNPDEDKE